MKYNVIVKPRTASDVPTVADAATSCV